MKNYDFGLTFIIAAISCFFGQYYSQQNINAINVTISLLIGVIVTLFVNYTRYKNITKR